MKHSFKTSVSRYINDRKQPESSVTRTAVWITITPVWVSVGSIRDYVRNRLKFLNNLNEPRKIP